MARRNNNNYLKGRELAAEIWKSKLTYSYSITPLPEPVMTCQFNYSGVTLPKDMSGFVRHFTYEHIPASDRRQRKTARGLGYQHTNFIPFKVYHDGHEIVRSHWSGDLKAGSFSTISGQLTRPLCNQIIQLVDRFSMQNNFRSYSYLDEMQSAALCQATAGILMFDDTKTDRYGRVNPFAYLTQIVKFAFIRTIKSEKKVQELRDKLLLSSGMKASHGFMERAAA